MKVKVVLSCFALSLGLGSASPENIFDAVKKDMDAFESRFDSAFKRPLSFFDKEESLEESFSKTLKKMRKKNQEMKKRICKMMKKIKKGGLTAADKYIDKIDDSFEDLQNEKEIFNTLVKKSDKLTDYKVDVNETDKTIKVSVSLPGYEKKDLDVEITDILDSKGNVTSKKLIISAKKKDEKEKGTTMHVQKKFFFSKTIGGKTHNVSYSIVRKNGHLKLSIDLPASIPTTDYTMEFKDDTLAVIFSKKEKSLHRKKLRFTK